MAQRRSRSPPTTALASEAPDLFLRDRPHHVWFDEAQRVPSLFEALRVDWRRTPPWLSNLRNRLVRSPKGTVADSGLPHHLLQLRDVDSLQAHPVLGASWESWVAAQLHVQASLLEPAPVFYHWRTQTGAEVDLVLDAGPAGLIPIEVKHATRIGDLHLRGLRSFLRDFADRASFGVVIYHGQHLARRADDILLVPAPALLT